MIGKKTPDNWQPIVDDMNVLLSVADAIAQRRYPGGCAPVGIVPALLVALAFHVNTNQRLRS